MIRIATSADAPAICAIYNHYITTSDATFEESPLSVEEMSRRIDATTAAWPWLVAQEHDAVIGYAYASQWKPRSGYRHTVESTVYLDPARVGRGAGSALYASLFDMLRGRDAHCAIAGIALPNAASVALHEKFGFTKVAHFRENGIKFGRWIDVGYWQRLL
ncbi:MAG: Acetyltransferase, GNAT family [Rhodanobacteraceae bacterium]|jgi:phosphinothricin acetyltransferase|nr:MAG: Acetyltransferase, GNAT family [Rhodanobacteraceae bacterium]